MVYFIAILQSWAGLCGTARIALDNIPDGKEVANPYELIILIRIPHIDLIDRCIRSSQNNPEISNKCTAKSIKDYND